MKKIVLSIFCCLLLCFTASCTLGEAEVGEYVPGVCTETKYSSDWLGLEFVPSADMYLSTSEEIEELLGSGDGTTAYEMLAMDIITNDNVIVMTEKIDDGITVSDYLSALNTQMNSGDGITAEFGSTKTVRLAGEKYTRIGYTITYDGYSVNQVMYIMKRADRIVSICITADGESAENAILACFKAK